MKVVEEYVRDDGSSIDLGIKFDVSYSQVYSWVKKYDTDGADGLMDRRGRHKTDDEVDEPFQSYIVQQKQSPQNYEKVGNPFCNP